MWNEKNLGGATHRLPHVENRGWLVAPFLALLGLTWICCGTMILYIPKHQWKMTRWPDAKSRWSNLEPWRSVEGIPNHSTESRSLCIRYDVMWAYHTPSNGKSLWEIPVISGKKQTGCSDDYIGPGISTNVSFFFLISMDSTPKHPELLLVDQLWMKWVCSSGCPRFSRCKHMHTAASSLIESWKSISLNTAYTKVFL